MKTLKLKNRKRRRGKRKLNGRENERERKYVDGHHKTNANQVIIETSLYSLTVHFLPVALIYEFR